MKRFALTFAAAGSILLIIVTAILWARSYSHWDESGYQTDSGRMYGATSRLGAISFDITDGWPAGQVWNGRVLFESDPLLVSALPAPSEWSWLGFGLHRKTMSIGIERTGWIGTARIVAVVVPHWAIILVLGLVVMLTAAPLVRQHRRSRRGLCVRCGYDLRASPERCPECGLAIRL